MATKRKTKNKTKKKSKTAASRKVTPPKKQVRKGRTHKKSTKKKAAQNKSVSKQKQLGKHAISAKAAGSETTKTRKKRQAPDELTFPRDTSGERSGEQSGDLQGLSDAESADSESVDELIEEGNAFEAGVVSGVEDAGDRDEKAVRTREVPEDDVPSEYLDED
jgi:hypothetical protein